MCTEDALYFNRDRLNPHRKNYNLDTSDFAWYSHHFLDVAAFDYCLTIVKSPIRAKQEMQIIDDNFV